MLQYTCTQSGLKFEVQGQEFLCRCKGETVSIHNSGVNDSFMTMRTCWNI